MRGVGFFRSVCLPCVISLFLPLCHIPFSLVRCWFVLRRCVLRSGCKARAVRPFWRQVHVFCCPTYVLNLHVSLQASIPSDSELDPDIRDYLRYVALHHRVVVYEMSLHCSGARDYFMCQEKNMFPTNQWNHIERYQIGSSCPSTSLWKLLGLDYVLFGFQPGVWLWTFGMFTSSGTLWQELTGPTWEQLCMFMNKTHWHRCATTFFVVARCR